MGIVKISDLLHDDIRDASKAMSRSVNAQAEYWIRLGIDGASSTPSLTTSRSNC